MTERLEESPFEVWLDKISATLDWVIPIAICVAIVIGCALIVAGSV